MTDRNRVIVLWIARVVLLAIFVIVGVLPKFTGGSAPLVEKLGQTQVTTIAVVELITIVLILVPATTLVGEGLAILAMLGAIGAHFGPVGFEGDFFGVFIAALIALGAGVTAFLLDWQQRKAANHDEDPVPSES